MTAAMLIATSEAGRALGEDNPSATLTNRDVATMRRLREDDAAYWTYRRLGEAFGCHKRYAEKICKYEKRCQAPADYRRAR